MQALQRCLAFLVILTSVSRADAQIAFRVTQLLVALDSSDGLQAIALADVNRDGRPDILGINDNTDAFEVFLNDGAGGFSSQPSITITVGDGLAAIASGDFNHDGNPDVVLVDGSADNAIFLFGDGTGHFSNEKVVSVSAGPVAVVVADLDNDGIDDAAVLSDAEVYLIRSNGNGSFSPFTPATVGTRSAGGFAIASGLVDGNPFVDLVVTNNQEAGTVSVLLGNGNGTFKAARLNNAGAGAAGVVVAKLDDDASQDIAVVDSFEIADLNVSLLYGNNDGTFEPDQRTTAEVLSAGVAAADFDLDGRIDLAVTNASGGLGLAILRNDPGCSECTPPMCECMNGFDLAEIQGFGDAGAIQAADLNGDGKPDLVVLGDGETLGVMLNITGATPTPTASPGPSRTPTATRTSTSTLTPTPTNAPTARATASPTLPPAYVPDQGGCSVDAHDAGRHSDIWWVLTVPLLVAGRRRQRQR